MARQLHDHGFDASALEGGYNAWKAEFPVEPKGKGEQGNTFVAVLQPATSAEDTNKPL